MKVYRSKISWGIFLPIFIILLLTTIFIATESWWVASISILPVAVPIGYIFLKTTYVVTDGLLKIKCGFLYNQQIKISSIRQIKETNNPISSPALSLDRLEIKFDKYSSVLISPKEKAIFIEHLKQINTAIEFITRKK